MYSKRAMSITTSLNRFMKVLRDLFDMNTFVSMSLPLLTSSASSSKSGVFPASEVNIGSIKDAAIKPNFPYLRNCSSSSLYGKIFAASEPSLQGNFKTYWNKINQTLIKILHFYTILIKTPTCLVKLLNFRGTLSANYRSAYREALYLCNRTNNKQYHTQAMRNVKFASR